MSDNLSHPEIRKSEIHLNIWLFPVLAGLFGILYAFSNFRGWLVFFIGFCGAWLFALLWVISLRRNLRLERKLHLAWARVGDSVQEELKLINTSWFPAIWIEIDDTSDALSKPIKYVSDIGLKSTRTRYFSHLCKKRGLYKLGPTRLRTSDPFGIYSLTINDYSSDRILVTPPLLPMGHAKIVPQGWVGAQQSKRGVLEHNISDGGVRKYQPGDSLRRIHWPASAHSEELVVKHFEAPTSGDWWIYLDLDKNSQAGEGFDSTLELIIILAASLATQRLNRKKKVGLALAGPDLVWIEPRADPAHGWRILKALAVASAGEIAFVDLVRMRPASPTATMIAITASTDPAWIGAVRCRQPGGQFAFLVDPSEFGAAENLGALIFALTSSAIPYQQTSRLLLQHAYPSLNGGTIRRKKAEHTGDRYINQGRADWRRMD